jgi:hypothetical protein
LRPKGAERPPTWSYPSVMPSCTSPPRRARARPCLPAPERPCGPPRPPGHARPGYPYAPRWPVAPAPRAQGLESPVDAVAVLGRAEQDRHDEVTGEVPREAVVDLAPRAARRPRAAPRGSGRRGRPGSRGGARARRAPRRRAFGQGAEGWCGRQCQARSLTRSTMPVIRPASSRLRRPRSASGRTTPPAAPRACGAPWLGHVHLVEEDEVRDAPLIEEAQGRRHGHRPLRERIADQHAASAAIRTACACAATAFESGGSASPLTAR